MYLWAVISRQTIERFYLLDLYMLHIFRSNVQFTFVAFDLLFDDS